MGANTCSTPPPPKRAGCLDYHRRLMHCPVANRYEDRMQVGVDPMHYAMSP